MNLKKQSVIKAKEMVCTICTQLATKLCALIFIHHNLQNIPGPTLNVLSFNSAEFI